MEIAHEAVLRLDLLAGPHLGGRTHRIADGRADEHAEDLVVQERSIRVGLREHRGEDQGFEEHGLRTIQQQAG